MSDYTVGVVLTGVSLFSADMDRTAEFYKAIGVKLEKSIHGWGPNYNYLDVLAENGICVIFQIYPLSPGQIAGYEILSFDVTNLSEVIKRLMEIKAPLVSPLILEKCPALRDVCTLVIFKDPDGRKVTITQHGKVKARPA